MRTPFIAGNWKMFKTAAEAAAFAEEFKALYKDTDVKTAICAPFVHLAQLKAAFEGTGIGVGAQNAHYEDEGAYTGEISVMMPHSNRVFRRSSSFSMLAGGRSAVMMIFFLLS